MPSVLDTVPDRVTGCSRFANNHGRKMITIALQVNYQKTSATSVSQGGASPRTKDIKNRANHSDAVIFLSIHTHKHRANQSSAILLKSKSERADLPNSIESNS